MPLAPATRTQRAVAIALGADCIVFLALLASYIYLRVQAPTWPAQFHFASGLIAFAITLFALAGSFSIYYAVQHQAKQSYEIAMRLTVAVCAVWASVFILLGMEWVRLLLIMQIGFNSSVFSSTYFMLTGFYALHILFGLIYLGIVAAKIKTADAGAAALFVHVTNAMWLILFVAVYVASTDLQGI